MLFIFFFFKQKTAYEMRISDWSSDVCSSDLRLVGVVEARLAEFFALYLRAGAFRRGDPRRAARLVIAICLGLDPHRLFLPVDAIGAAPSTPAGFVIDALMTLFAPEDGDERDTIGRAPCRERVGQYV